MAIYYDDNFKTIGQFKFFPKTEEHHDDTFALNNTFYSDIVTEKEQAYIKALDAEVRTGNIISGYRSGFNTQTPPWVIILIVATKQSPLSRIDYQKMMPVNYFKDLLSKLELSPKTRKNLEDGIYRSPRLKKILKDIEDEELREKQENEVELKKFIEEKRKKYSALGIDDPYLEFEYNEKGVAMFKFKDLKIDLLFPNMGYYHSPAYAQRDQVYFFLKKLFTKDRSVGFYNDKSVSIEILDTSSKIYSNTKTFFYTCFLVGPSYSFAFKLGITKRKLFIVKVYKDYQDIPECT